MVKVSWTSVRRELLTFLEGLTAKVAFLLGKSGQTLLAAVGHCEIALIEGITAAFVYQRVAIPTFDGHC